MVIIRETEENGEESELGRVVSPRLDSKRDAVDSSTQSLLAGDVCRMELVGRLTCREKLQPGLVVKRSITRLM